MARTRVRARRPILTSRRNRVRVPAEARRLPRTLRRDTLRGSRPSTAIFTTGVPTRRGAARATASRRPTLRSRSAAQQVSLSLPSVERASRLIHPLQSSKIHVQYLYQSWACRTFIWTLRPCRWAELGRASGAGGSRTRMSGRTRRNPPRYRKISSG